MEVERLRKLEQLHHTATAAYPEGHPLKKAGELIIANLLNELRNDEDDFTAAVTEYSEYIKAYTQTDLGPIIDATNEGLFPEDELEELLLERRSSAPTPEDLANGEAGEISETARIYFGLLGSEIINASDLVAENKAQSRVNESLVVKESLASDDDISYDAQDGIDSIGSAPELNTSSQEASTQTLDQYEDNLRKLISSIRQGSQKDIIPQEEHLSIEELKIMWADLRARAAEAYPRWGKIERDLAAIEKKYGIEYEDVAPKSYDEISTELPFTKVGAQVAVSSAVTRKLHAMLTAHTEQVKPAKSQTKDIKPKKHHGVEITKELLEELNSSEELSVPKLSRVMLQLIPGMTKAHESDLIHLLTHEDPESEVDVTRELVDATEQIWAQIVINNGLTNDKHGVDDIEGLLRSVFCERNSPAKVARDRDLTLSEVQEWIQFYMLKTVQELASNILAKPLTGPDQKKN